LALRYLLKPNNCTVESHFFENGSHGVLKP